MPLSSPTDTPTISSVKPSTLPLTGQQQDILDAVHSGSERTVVEALAGTGKTHTLTALAHSFPGRASVYLAFNKSVKLEAERKFPDWVHVTTAHGLAYQAVGKQYGNRLPGNPGASRMSANQMARIMKVKPAMLDTGTVNPVALTRMAQATVNAFMKTADPALTSFHIPARVYAHHSPADIADAIMPVARRIWEDLTRTDGRFRFTHDVYLKLWQLGNPVLPFSLTMFDEAQDADPVIASIIARQTGQKVWVGDRNQAIYGWRGAVDAMSKVENATRLPLTQSWRFGQAIADEANQWLDMLGSPYKVVGNPAINSSIGAVEIPRAILCRGNGTALGWVLKFHGIGVAVALAPGTKDAGKDIERFAWAAKDLMNGEGTDHPELVGFQTWMELVKFVEEEEDTDDLKRMVGIINRVGVSAVIDAVRGCVTEDKAMITVSTAHKAKGLEWSSVRVADDFVPPNVDELGLKRDTEGMMLNYVTVTRAKERLEPGALGEPQLWDL